MVMEGDFQAPWKEGDKRYSRIVFIGRNLDDDELQRGFAGCVA
jgi:G3E family GTPase